MVEKKAAIIGITPGPTADRVCHVCRLPLIVSAVKLAEMTATHGGEDALWVVHHHCLMTHIQAEHARRVAESARAATDPVVPCSAAGVPADGAGNPPA